MCIKEQTRKCSRSPSNVDYNNLKSLSQQQRLFVSNRQGQGSGSLATTETHCDTLQRLCVSTVQESRSLATHCNILQRTAILCNTLQQLRTTCPPCKDLNHGQHTTIYCNTLQQTATYCNTCTPLAQPAKPRSLDVYTQKIHFFV